MQGERINMRKASFLLFAFIIFGGSFFQKTMREVSQDEKQELVQYLRTHWKTPEDYVVEKFSNYDIVFIGEYHRIKHDAELIQNLIPHLYKKGVYNLGIEFGSYEYEDKLDLLITADRYDEDLARWLMFRWTEVNWGYQEYMDIYRSAWELNKSLSNSAPKFRIVNLNYRPNWPAAKVDMMPELWKQVWRKGDPDEYMAEVILREFVDKGRKALIYSGYFHALTHYHLPIYDFENKKLVRFSSNRMGNIVYNKIPKRVFNIFLHSPWPTKTSFEHDHYPVGGIIDGVMQEFNDKRVGFDVKGSPFGKLRDDDAYFSIGYDNFALDTFCDGYIFQKHFSDYEGCTVDTAFITKDNFQEAVNYLGNPRERKFLSRPEDFIEAMRKEADMKRRLHGLK
jgi:uncharacterized iron-regulated protein